MGNDPPDASHPFAVYGSLTVHVPTLRDFLPRIELFIGIFEIKGSDRQCKHDFDPCERQLLTNTIAWAALEGDAMRSLTDTAHLL